MKVFFHPDFNQVYTSDPAAAPGRMEAIVQAIEEEVTLSAPKPASETDIAEVHTLAQIERVRRSGLYEIAALAAGGAIQAAIAGLNAPSFGLIRPPGHHASADSSWGFCYFNNMAIALSHLRRTGRSTAAFVLDFDLHYGDGTVNILGAKPYITLFNPEASDRTSYLTSVQLALERFRGDVIGVSAGFDYHRDDWGGLLHTEDYLELGRMVHRRAKQLGAGCFGILEGGYNHQVLGLNVRAFLQGLRSA